MKSPDTHINPPSTRVNMALDPMPLISEWKRMALTKYQYDLLEFHDPHTLYIITDHRNLLYYGDLLIQNHFSYQGPKFVIGLRNHNYVVMSLVQSEDHADTMLVYDVEEYQDPNAAIEAIHRYERIGSSGGVQGYLYDLLKRFIQKEIGVHELLIHILTMYGFRDDPRLQQLNEIAISYGYSAGMEDLPTLLRESLHSLKEGYPLSLLRDYSDLYDILVSFDLLRTKKYTKVPIEELNLSKEIAKIHEYFIKKLLSR